ncbi:MAG: cadmium-translocating P-type ATPase [Phycisphaerae bacterium]|nr:cadmium-translocating P-type ATPase [Phycisphaerae bacterium]
MTVADPPETSTHATVSVGGMTCASCAASVNKAASRLPGVTECAVSLSRGRAAITFDPARTSADAVADAIREVGYTAHVEEADSNSISRDDEHARHALAWRNRAIVGVALWLPIETLHWIHRLTSFHAMHGLHWIDWLSIITSSIAMVYVGSAFYRSAWAALRHRTTNMDTLISMGATVAYGYSAVALIGYLAGAWTTLPDLYFMEAAGLLALISLGHAMEARARTAAGRAIRELLELAPATAWRFSADANLPAEVPVAELHVGDRLLVRPGDRVPIDGIVIEGSSSIDESMLTGESLPVARAIGDKVFGGTINHDGRLTIRATAVGSETSLAQIIRLVETAQDSKPPVQKLADQIAAVFVPAVLLIALITAVAWFTWGTAHHWDSGHIWMMLARSTCSVLIIACPCALGLAVPAAILVGTGIGARRGILIRNIDAIQQAEKIDSIMLDKTGTITRGKPVVSAIEPADGISTNELLRLAAAAEQYSQHPLAKAIVAYARQGELTIPPADQFQSEPGFGIIARVDGRSLFVGNQRLLERYRVTVPMADTTSVFVAEQTGDSLARLLGRITLSDELKSDSAAAVERLRRLKMQLQLLSGDNPSAVRAVAKAVGIGEVKAEIRPAEKAAIVNKCRSAGRTVAMVGDGINDAPALAAADLGIAIGSGSDIAKETGGIILVSGSLHGVADAIDLSRATMRVIRQNLFLAFIYNVLAIPLAAFGLLNPLIAAAAMALSDVTVIGNALRLKYLALGGSKACADQHHLH